WDKLSPDVQAAMIEAGRKTTERACALIDKDDRAALERLQADGVTLVAFDAANRALFAEKLAPVAEAWAKGEDGKGRQGSETLAAFRAAIAKQQ
ncbi:MAG: hypothetical protein RIM80_07880, partial [Alphaproteobacteria bacterium]